MQLKSSVVFYILWISHYATCWIIDAKVIIDVNDTRKYWDDNEANFGPQLPTDENMEGYLVVANPSNACVPIQPPPKGYYTNYKNYFALIQESSCDFSHQVYMAQVSQYKAAIIYLKYSNTPVTMGAGKDANKVVIPSVNVGKDAGEFLKKCDYRTNARITLQANMSVPYTWYLIPFIVVFGVCFLFITIFSTARFMRNRRNLRNSRLPKESLKSIPTKKFKKGDEYDICAICLEEFEDGDKLRILPCNHVYHCKCVDPWLTGGKRSCPVCNRPVEVARKQRSARQPILPSTSSTEVDPPSDNEDTDHINSSQNENEDGLDVNERTPLISGRRPRSNGAMSV